IKYTPELKSEYESRWGRMKITRLPQAKIVRDLIMKGKTQYQEIAKHTGVPWEFIGLTHYREGACDFMTVLHNGERIIGTQRKTRLVPAGYGPFKTWEESALSAVHRQKLHLNKDWSIGKMAFLLEGFNGYGYHGKGVPSPYLWGGSDIYQKGKYVSDGVYDPNHIDRQMGCLPVLRLLQNKTEHLPPTTPAIPSGVSPLPSGKQNAVLAAVLAAGAAVYQFFLEHWVWFALVGLLIVAGYSLYKYRRYKYLSERSPKAESHIDPSRESPPTMEFV